MNRRRCIRWLALCALLACVGSIAASQDFPRLSYDIYGMDVTTGRIFQITHVPNRGEYNPSWSNNNKFIVHDVVYEAGQDLAVTNVATGETVPLVGGEGGNDGRYSPNGQWIAFDDMASVYVVPAGGGTRRLVVADAVTPRWSPNSKRLVFTRPSDGSLRTIDVSGTDERLTRTHDPYGDVLYSPAWSPDGQWIAFMWYGYIMKVPVDRLGQALADFTIIANDQNFNYSPAWSNNSKTVVFGRNNALWSVPATGGDYTQLTTPTAWYAGDYDPAYSNNGQYIAFARATGPLAKPVVAQQKVIPAEFELLQNYPNPFNPTTAIRYVLPADSYVSLVVYDLLGLKVAVLVNERVMAGHHEVVFDASRLATGTYVYRLQAGNSVLMKKMTLVK